MLLTVVRVFTCQKKEVLTSRAMWQRIDCLTCDLHTHDLLYLVADCVSVSMGPMSVVRLYPNGFHFLSISFSLFFLSLSCNCGACMPTNTPQRFCATWFLSSITCQKEAQRNESWNSLRCAVLCVVRSCQKMIRHFRTWLHTFAQSFHMVIWSVNHLILHVCHTRCQCLRYCSSNTNIQF